MSYTTKYRIAYTNELSEEVEILLKKKDAAFVAIQNYAVEQARLSYKGDEGKMTPIIGLNLTVSFNVRATDPDPWEEFVDAEKDTWRMTCTVDGFTVFQGFVLPDIGTVPFQDPPFAITLVAVDEISLLKDHPLIKPDGTKFSGEDLIITYIAYALQQTGLTPPIRVYDNVYHRSMLTRADDPKYDFFGQAKLEYRTFLKDAVTFTDCYDALEKIFKDTYRLLYWKEQWVIIRLSLLQYWPNDRYYTVYDYNGENPVGYEYLEDYVPVGKEQLIYPHGEDQLKSIKPAMRATKTIKNYIPWPEIPRNNKFENGVQLDTGTAYDTTDLDGDGDTAERIGTFKNWTVTGWTYGAYSGFPSQNAALPALSPTTANFYRHSVFNDFNVEINRELVINEVLPSEGTRGVLISEGIPVIAGDKIAISWDHRLSSGGSGTQQLAMIFIITNGGQKYFIDSQNTSQMSPFIWKLAAGGVLISRFYETAENWNQVTSISVGPPPIPASGTLYIGLVTPGITGSTTYIKNFSVDYKPYVAGGYIQVKGEYLETSQDVPYPDKSEQEVTLSDNPHKIFIGTLLDIGGVPLSADFYRHGISESHSYLYFTNIAKFNHEYRRFWFVEGSFTGTKCSPVDDPTNQQPIALQKIYRLVDIPNADRRFMLTAPIDIDLVTGWSTLRFHETLADPKTIMKPESRLNLIQRLIDAINATTELQWNSASGAPAHGTSNFPPIAEKGGLFTSNKPDSFTVYLHLGDAFTPSAVNIGLDNTPTITKTGSSNVGGVQVETFKVGPVLKLGDIFTMSLYGHNVAVAVEEVPTAFQNDGVQVGSTEFKYIFQ